VEDVEGRRVAVLVAVGSEPVPAQTLDTVARVLADVVVVRLGAGGGAGDLELPAATGDLETRVRGKVVVLIDLRCSGLSATLISDALERSAGHSVVFVQPALETLKLVRSGRVVRTVDREQMRVVSTPAVLSGDLLCGITDLTAALHDPAVLVMELRRLGPLELLEAPPHVRRVSPGETSDG